MSRIVVALGGNALGNTPKEQEIMIEGAAETLSTLIEQGHEVIISHGNGPQVGMLLSALEFAHKNDGKTAKFELPECIAMSQGYIGQHLQKGIKKALKNKNISKSVVTVVTQTVVDKNDEAFKDPTKPIGAFLSEEEANEIMANKPGVIYKEDAGRGYRQMVASPQPLDIIEKDAVLNLLNSGFVVITCGGAGVPVINNGNDDFESISAVVDKDFASAKLAELLDADYLFILTAVDKAYLNFNTNTQEAIDVMTPEEADKFIAEGHFAPGSMLPKVQAAAQFVKSQKGRKSVIASLEKASLIMSGQSGTLIQ